MMQIIAARLAALFVLIVALCGVVHGSQVFRQDLRFTAAETELGFWGRGDYRPEPATIRRTGQALNALLSGAPTNPQYLALQANYMAWQGYWTEDFQAAQQFGQQAVDAQYAALEFRPAHRHSWVKMVEYTSRIKDGKPVRAAAQARVKALEPAPASI